MRKNVFLWSAIVIFVLILVLAFENIWLVQQYFVLFYTFNSSTTVIILLAGVLGFLVGFFAMLYSFEVQKERALEDESDAIGTPPAEVIEKEEETQDEETKSDSEKTEPSNDTFDDDDEVLG